MFNTAVRLIPPLTSEFLQVLTKNDPMYFYTPDNDWSLVTAAAMLIQPRVEECRIFVQRTDNFGVNNIVNSENVYRFVYDYACGNLQELGFTTFPQISKFIETHCHIKMTVWANMQNRTVVFDVPASSNLIQTSSRILNHALASFIPLYFPDLFMEKKLDEDEHSLLRSLNNSTSIGFENYVRKLASRDSFRRPMLMNTLRGMEKIAKEAEISQVKSSISEYENEIERIIRNFNSAQSAKQDLIIRLAGLETVRDNTQDELFEYMISNKNIFEISTQGSKLSFNVRTYLDTFDADSWDLVRDAVVERTDDFREGVFSDKANKILLLDALFSENASMHIKMCAHWEFDIAYQTARATSGWNYIIDSVDYADYLPNPHYDFHSCLGQNGPDIMNQLSKGDIVSAIEYCIAASKSVNIHEMGPTFIPFINRLFSRNNKVIETYDGLSLTPGEAVEYLKKKVTENETDLHDDRDEAVADD